MTPGGTSKAFQDVKAGINFGGNILDMGGEGEVGVKGNAKDGRSFRKRKRGFIYGNLRVESGLVVIRGEKGNRRLLRGN